MLIEKCNRCGKISQYNYFNFNITEHMLTGSIWNNLDGPDVRLDDFHLCAQCMSKFVEFVKEGKKND